MREQQQEAMIALDHRVTRLEELLALYQAGELGEALLDAAITEAEKATEADRDIYYEIYSEALGPFDLDRYGVLQSELSRRLEGLRALRELYYDGIATAEQWQGAEAIVAASWRVLAPWRDALRQQIENTPEAIEAERQAALKSRGFRIPTERRVKRKLTEEEAFNQKLKKLTSRGRR